MPWSFALTDCCQHVFCCHGCHGEEPVLLLFLRNANKGRVVTSVLVSQSTVTSQGPIRTQHLNRSGSLWFFFFFFSLFSDHRNGTEWMSVLSPDHGSGRDLVSEVFLICLRTFWPTLPTTYSNLKSAFLSPVVSIIFLIIVSFFFIFIYNQHSSLSTVLDGHCHQMCQVLDPNVRLQWQVLDTNYPAPPLHLLAPPTFRLLMCLKCRRAQINARVCLYLCCHCVTSVVHVSWWIVVIGQLTELMESNSNNVVFSVKNVFLVFSQYWRVFVNF